MTEQKKKQKKSAAGSVTAEKSKLIRATHVPLHELMASLVTDRKERKSEDFETVVFGGNPKADLSLLAPLVKSMFKADHPYRTKLGSFTSLITATNGVLNQSVLPTSIGSTGEWTNISALFDEFFLHSYTIHYQPWNAAGGVGVAAGSTVNLYPTGSNNTTVSNLGLIMVCLFNSGATYGSAAAMISNPSAAYHHSGFPFKYTWRNNVKFDPRGPEANVSAWTGWTPIQSTANLGGTIQIRNFGDQAVGDGTHATTMGNMVVKYDVSFRSRA